MTEQPTPQELEDLPINLFEYQPLAKAQLSRMAYDYYASGAMDELTLRDNRAAFERRRLRFRVLAGVGERSSRGEVLGSEFSFPVLIAPMAFQGLADPAGELATARAAGAAGTVMVLSTLSNVALEEVVAASSGAVWFQLYVYRDREATQALVRRAEAAGCRALVLTVDAPLLGRRERDIRNRFHLPAGLEAKNLHAAGYGALAPVAGESGLAAYVGSLLDPNLTWDDLSWLRSITSLPVVVKGIVRGDDADLAVEAGAAGIVVSNHGGRQLDTAVATLDCLEEVSAAVAGRVPILLDGGVRRGTDVIKAIALGAQAVLLGRPILWGLGARGEAGVAHVLDLLSAEFDQALALCGCRNLGEIKPDLLV
ncbi:MAG: alpha-hydroxy-acid oxidizing protein [Planctomycetes bacterium]|nr:alpha-hydroxy-acid oxidizing protein [Planctomycetota bacterium]